MLRLIEKSFPENFFLWMKPFYVLYGFVPPKNGLLRYAYIIFATAFFGLLSLELISLWSTIILEYDKRGFENMSLQITSSLFSTIFQFRIFMWLANKNKMDEIVKIICRPTFSFECFNIYKLNRKEVDRMDGTENYRYMYCKKNFCNFNNR